MASDSRSPCMPPPRLDGTELAFDLSSLMHF